MRSKTLFINRNINDGQRDYDFLFDLCQQARGLTHTDVFFNFEDCGFLRQNAVVVLGSLVRQLQQQQNTVFFQLDTIEQKIRINLEQSGFLYSLGLGGTPWDGNSIPYREDITTAEDDYADYLSSKWLGKWISVSDELHDYVISRVIEAYINVFDHANSPVGVITCGQHYPNLSELMITMVDMGVGIPYRVREYLGENDKKADEALRWAFEGTKKPTGPHSIARGNGLKLLKSFIQENHGKLEIYSETGYACIDANNDRYKNRSKSFQGTIVQITLKCDAYHYKLPEENDYDTNEWFI